MILVHALLLMLRNVTYTCDSFPVTPVCNSDYNITIGFAQPSYTIREDGENISVCLEVDVFQQQSGVITVQIITVAVTATGKTTNHAYSICML